MTSEPQATSGGTRRGEAARLAARGFRVFPLLPGQKRPAAEGWKAAATSDAFDVLESFPDAANIGIATGDDFTVIDADVKHGGLENVKALGLPATLTVRTRSGGLHLYFKTLPGQAVSNSASKLAPGVDVRGAGGYVVAPGSIVDGKPYVIEKDVPLVGLPQAIAALCGAARKRSADAGKLAAGVERDSVGGIERARAFVLDRAPTALDGNRDNAAVKVAMRCYDFGVSQATCLDLLGEWNEAKCSPPLEDEDLERIAGSAEKSKQDAIGRDVPTRHFDAIEDPAAGPAPSASPMADTFRSRVRPYSATKESGRDIPQRPWLIEGKLLRNAVTVIGAPGSAGKSLWSLQMAVALAIGETPYDGSTLAEAMIGTPVAEQTRVLVINNEDPNDELDRRLEAVMTYWGVDRSSVHGKVHLYSGASEKFRLAARGPKGTERTAIAKLMCKYVREDGIGCIVFDPLVSMHDANEIDNTEMQGVMDVITATAAELGVAVLVIHHTAKPKAAASGGYAGDVNTIRGASAIKDAARAALTMFVASVLSLTEDSTSRANQS